MTNRGQADLAVGAVGEKRAVEALLKASRSPVFWLIVVSILYCVAQLTLVDPGRFPSTDESIYIAEVSRFADRVAWGPQRSRGITFVVAPIVQLTEQMTPMRTYMAVASSGALFGAFFVWCRLAAWAAPLGAALFASSWVAMFYGSEVMPNLYAALGAVGAVGMLLIHARSRSRGTALGVAAIFAIVALFRPIDAAVLFAGIGAAWLLGGRPWPFRILVMGAIGVLLGVVPWIAEVWWRHAGLRIGVDMVTSGNPSLVENIFGYLLSLDGPLRPPEETRDIAAGGVVGLAVLIFTAVAGYVWSTREPRVQALTLLAPSVVLGMLYLTGIGIASPRYMLPTLALLCLASGIGMVELIRRVGSRPTTTLLGALLLALLLWNLAVLHEVGPVAAVSRAQARTVGEALDERVSGVGGCYFLSQRAWAEISLVSGCRGAELLNKVENDLLLAEARESGTNVYVVSKHTVMTEAVSGNWTCMAVSGVPKSTGWRICELGKT